MGEHLFDSDDDESVLDNKNKIQMNENNFFRACALKIFEGCPNNPEMFSVVIKKKVLLQMIVKFVKMELRFVRLLCTWNQFGKKQ